MHTFHVEVVASRILAAVRRRITLGTVSQSFRPALDEVWAFLASNPELRGTGHNVFVYHHEAPPYVTVDFGVEVTREHAGQGEVACVTTPAGEAVSALHRGPYERLHETHAALRAWCLAHGRRIGAHSLEVYGDWSDDPMALETTIQYMLLPVA